MEQQVGKQFNWDKFRNRVFTILEIGQWNDYVSKTYDMTGVAMIVINLIVSVMLTFNVIYDNYSELLKSVELVTVVFFAIDYVLRIWTAKYLYPNRSEKRAILKYLFSFTGIIDMFSCVPYFLPVFFPSGMVAFRMFRIVRIFRLFRINAYYDSLNVITEVLYSKAQQLLSSVFIIFILMLASSLCMYSLENQAQPEVFANAFSGIWWSVSTLLTVGYGDIYPITVMGKVFGIIISILGVGMVAIPTGIISAGFVDQYSKIKKITEYANEENVNFIKIHMKQKDKWVNKAIKDLGLPRGIVVAIIQRGKEIVVPRGDVVLLAGDIVVLGAESFSHDEHIELKEIILKEQHPWRGQKISEIDISRRSVIVMIKRRGRMMIPHGDLVFMTGDKVLMYTQTRMPEAEKIQI